MSSSRGPRKCLLSYHRVLTKEKPLLNAKANPHVGMSYLVSKKNGTRVALSNKKMNAESSQNLCRRPLNSWNEAPCTTHTTHCQKLLSSLETINFRTVYFSLVVGWFSCSYIFLDSELKGFMSRKNVYKILVCIS